MDPTDLLLKAAAPQDPRLGRPFVTLSHAQSLDGSIAARSGRPLALSGPESMTLTHSQRACHDAILVGIGTVLADNPRLTVRLVAGRDPQTVIMDSRLRFPPYAELLRHGRSPWIATAQEADSQRLEALETAGARVFRLPSADGWVDLVSLLKAFKRPGHPQPDGGRRRPGHHQFSRLPPGGPDGPDHRPLAGGGPEGGGPPGGPSHLPRFPRLHHLSYARGGEDLVVRGEPDWGE